MPGALAPKRIAGVPNANLATGVIGDNSNNAAERGFGRTSLDPQAKGYSHCLVGRSFGFGRFATMSLDYPGGFVRRLPETIAVYALVVAIAACASSGTGGVSTRTSPDKISRSEITASSATNAYEVISRLRPNWLRPPATATIGGGVVRSQALLVYLNSQRLEDVNALKSISAEGLDTAQWIDASRVQIVFNDAPKTAVAGAILLKTR